MGSTPVTTSRTVQIDIKCSHIVYLSYKGFHPIEKKKTMEKINLLIDKFNTVNCALFEEGKNIISEMTGSDKFRNTLKTHNLDPYTRITSTHRSELKAKSFNEMILKLTNYKDTFKKFIEGLVTKGDNTLSEINKKVESNEYWNYCSGNDSKNLKLGGNYSKIQKKFTEELTFDIKIYVTNTIEIIKSNLKSDKEKKIQETQEFLKKLIKKLKNEKAKLGQTEMKYKLISNLISLIKIIIGILSGKQNKLLSSQIETLNIYFKGDSVFESMKSIDPNTLKDKYFLSMVQCDDKETKKLILIIMSIQSRSSNRNNIVKTIIGNIDSIMQGECKLPTKQC